MTEHGHPDPAAAARQTAWIRQLHGLHRAGLSIASDLDLEELLGRLVDEARQLCAARYGALGILNAERTGLARFITRGLSEAEEARMGAHPVGRGLLGTVIHQGTSVRVERADQDPRSSGVPAAHPHPGPFVGVPIRIRDEVFGNIYLMGSPGDAPFLERDQRILEMLASQAAVAIDNARLFAETRQLVAELEQTKRARNRLHAYVSHDLRNVLTGAQLWAERLERHLHEEGRAPRGGELPPAGEDPGPPSPSEVALKIRRGTEHALRLVRDVLDLARLDEGNLPVWPRRIVLADLLGAAVDAVLPEAERRGVRVRRAPLDPPIHLVSDPDRVLQVVLNLMSNAVKACDAGDRVRVSAALTPPRAGRAEGVEIQVDDTGPGIETGRLAVLLGEASGEAGEPSRQGAGIGLPLSRSLAERLGGTLNARSAPGKGSTFTLWLPADVPREGRSGWIG